MDPVTIAAISAAINIGGNALAAWIGKGKDEEERQLRREAAEMYASLQPPHVQDLVAQQISGSHMASVHSDPALQATQDRVQAALLDRGTSGPSMSYRAAREQQGMEAARQAQGDREAVLAQGRARGMTGSGEELLAQLGAGQSAAQTERMAGVQSLADDEQGALQAMLQAGNMAGQREQRNLDTQMRVAGAEDDIDMFNSGLNWQQQTFNAQQRQQNFQNQLNLTDRQAGIKLGDADLARRQGERERQMIGGAAQGVGYGVASIGQPAKSPAVGVQPKMTPTVPTPAAPADTFQQSEPNAIQRRRREG